MGALLFRGDASSSVGMGHYRRLGILARQFEGEKILILRTDDLKLESEAGVIFDNVITLPIDCTFEQEIFLISALRIKANVSVIDISNSITYSQINSFQKLVDFYHQMGNAAVIDGLGADSVLSKVTNLECDYYITPYVGAPKLRGKFQHLNSEKFFVLDPSYNEVEYEMRKVAKNVLLTMGGSDPNDMTLKIVKQLLHKNCKAHIKVVVGPLFTNDQFKSLTKELQGQSNWSIINNPSDIKQEYLWADVVVSASGLSKYELASLGIPMVLVSRNQTMHDINQSFTQKAECLDLGPIDNLTTDMWIDDVERLLLNYDQRASQSKVLKNLIDGLGAERILKCLIQN